MEELQNQEITASAQKAMELENEFDYDEYQVVRKELFAHQRDPAIVIRSDSVSFNTACIKTFKGVVYIQLLISPELHRIAIKKCGKNDKDAIRWCIEKADGRTWKCCHARETLYAGFPHINFYSDIKLAENFVRKCISFGENNG